MTEIERIKEQLKGKKPPEKVFKHGLSTGSTLLNLACSGDPNWGFKKGTYNFIVGDSASGKTFLSLTCLAEAAKNKAFSSYRFIYDNAEDGAQMDVQKFFGSKVAERLEPPREDGDGPVYSSSIEEFYDHVDDAIRSKKPFIYVLDSMDALSSEDEIDKAREQKVARRKGKEAAGSYGDGKAKKNSAGLRRLIPALRKTGSILIIINQTRDNVAAFSFDKKTRSGGRALKFYATLELWSSVKEKLTKSVKQKNLQVGIVCQVKVKKNRLTGKERTVETPIYHSYGFDDVGGCLRFLVEYKHWPVGEAPEFGLHKVTEGKIIHHVEENGLESELRGIVAKVWAEVEEACELDRKKRYE